MLHSEIKMQSEFLMASFKTYNRANNTHSSRFARNHFEQT